MYQENTQVKFEFGSGQIIFGRVMPLGLRKVSTNYIFRSSESFVDTLRSNLVVRYIRGKRRSSSNLGLVE